MSEQTPRAKKELPLPSPRKSGRKSHTKMNKNYLINEDDVPYISTEKRMDIYRRMFIEGKDKRSFGGGIHKNYIADTMDRYKVQIFRDTLDNTTRIKNYIDTIDETKIKKEKILHFKQKLHASSDTLSFLADISFSNEEKEEKYSPKRLYSDIKVAELSDLKGLNEDIKKRMREITGIPNKNTNKPIYDNSQIQRLCRPHENKALSNFVNKRNKSKNTIPKLPYLKTTHLEKKEGSLTTRKPTELPPLQNSPRFLKTKLGERRAMSLAKPLNHQNPTTTTNTSTTTKPKNTSSFQHIELEKMKIHIKDNLLKSVLEKRTPHNLLAPLSPQPLPLKPKRSTPHSKSRSKSPKKNLDAKIRYNGNKYGNTLNLVDAASELDNILDGMEKYAATSRNNLVPKFNSHAKTSKRLYLNLGMSSFQNFGLPFASKQRFSSKKKKLKKRNLSQQNKGNEEGSCRVEKEKEKEKIKNLSSLIILNRQRKNKNRISRAHNLAGGNTHAGDINPSNQNNPSAHFHSNYEFIPFVPTKTSPRQSISAFEIKDIQNQLAIQ